MARHIENSIFVDVDHDLASEKTANSGRHPLPDPHLLSEKLSQWGMTNNKQAGNYENYELIFFYIVKTKQC